MGVVIKMAREPVETEVVVSAYYPSNWEDMEYYNLKVGYNGNEYWAVRIPSVPSGVTRVGQGRILYYLKSTGELHTYGPADIYVTNCGYLVAKSTLYEDLIVQTIYPVAAKLYINDNEVEWDKTAPGMWTKGGGVTLYTGTNTIEEVVGDNTVLSTNYDIPEQAMYARITFVPKDDGCYTIETYWSPYPTYPRIDRANSGVIIDGELKPPGSYTVKKGTSIPIPISVVTRSRWKMRVVILINGEIAHYWDVEESGNVSSFKHSVTADRDMEITMAVYYYDESEGVYKKSDEYGCGGD